MTKILAINGSYSDDGSTDRVVNIMTETLQDAGAQVETILLRDFPIEFCMNCRECTQKPGATPGECVHQDDMHVLVEKIEASDGFILASPTNFGSVTAIFKRFMERLVVYAYWPWGRDTPLFRKANVMKKKAVIVSSCAAPSIIGRLFFDSQKQLKMTAKTIGAETMGIVFTGLSAKTPHQDLSEKTRNKAKSIAQKLI